MGSSLPKNTKNTVTQEHEDLVCYFSDMESVLVATGE